MKRLLLIALVASGLAFVPMQRSDAQITVSIGYPGYQNVTFPGICGFDVQAIVTGKEGVISLPSGGSIVTGPATFGTFTDLSDPTKNVTQNMTGVFHISSDQNGNTIVTVTGRGVAGDPSFGLVLLIGEFTLVFNPQGNISSGPTGNGKIIDICQLIK